MIVSNSTVLISLAKIDRLDLLNRLYRAVIIPEKVKTEVVDEGKKWNHLDAIAVEKQ